MFDYLVDEKLLREFKDVRLTKEPSPFPDKIKKIPANYSSMQISSDASHKKELTQIENKFKNLEKAYNKLLKKQSDTQEEMKILKTTNEQLGKEINIFQISNDKIQNEKTNLESQMEENKSYTRKLESRLVQGAKNQYLVEINNKLRKEIEEIKKQVDVKICEIEKLKCEVGKKNNEVKILNKALVFFY
jgi:chromosome segregation ATPase